VNEIAKVIVDAAYKIHITWGPGLFESVYPEFWHLSWNNME